MQMLHELCHNAIIILLIKLQRDGVSFDKMSSLVVCGYTYIES